MRKFENTVDRFSLPFRIAHWVNAFAFFALYLTALPMFAPSFQWIYSLLGGPAQARLLHRIFAVLFMLPMFYMIIADRKSFFHWLKTIVTWGKHDFGFFLPFGKSLFGKHQEVPKQDFYNAGEKVNSLLQIGAALTLMISGFMMWFPDVLPYGVQVWSYFFHNLGFCFALPAVVGHIYLSTLAPGGKEALHGMIKGDVPVEFAKEHYGRWYDQLANHKENDKAEGV